MAKLWPSRTTFLKWLQGLPATERPLVPASWTMTWWKVLQWILNPCRGQILTHEPGGVSTGRSSLSTSLSWHWGTRGKRQGSSWAFSFWRCPRASNDLRQQRLQRPLLFQTLLWRRLGGLDPFTHVWTGEGFRVTQHHGACLLHTLSFTATGSFRCCPTEFVSGQGQTSHALFF